MAIVGQRYRLGRLLGSGGFASVFWAHDEQERRDVALKIVPALDPSTTARFRAEALALSRLHSPNVARIYDAGRDDELGLYLVMELVEGPTLDPMALGRPLFPHEVLAAARALLSGLAEAHEASIVHRDIKPRNALVPGGIPGLSKLKLLDFGISGALRRAGSDRLTLDDDDAEALLGTPAYMAPELFVSRGRPGAACDVYSAGLVLFELLGAGPLFPEAADQTSARIASDAVLADRVPEPLASLLGRMLARDPRARFPDAREALSAVAEMATAPVQTVLPPPSPTTIPPPDVAEKTYVARVHRLPPDALAAFELALAVLDLPSLEAVARRHRGDAGDVGRVARALALALRLELDAAAMVLEPRLAESALARAVARCVVWPRARRATRARLESADDDWLADVPPSLAARLVSLAVGLTTMQDAERNAKTAARVAARCAPGSPERASADAFHVVSARLASRSHADVSAFRRLAAKAERDPLGETTRALALGMLSFRIDDRIARAELERAAAWGCETGATLLEVRALLAWGGLLVEAPDRMADGLLLLERASTLLADGDSPGLEHMAVHNGGVAMLVAGRYEDAAPYLGRARETGHEEGLLENEVLSGAIELAARVCVPEPPDLGPALAAVADDHLAVVSARAAGLAHVARAVHELRFGTLDGVTEEVRRALKHASDPGGGDALILAEAMGVLLAAAADDTVDLLARASELERLARDRGFASFYWFDVLATALRLAPPFREQAALKRALERLVLLLGPLKG